MATCTSGWTERGARAGTTAGGGRAAPLDVSAVRRDFPVLDQTVDGKPLVYLDNAASSQKPRQVVDAISRYYLRDHANVHRGVHELARRATEAYESARARIARWLNAAGPQELVWTRGTSEALNLVAFSLGQARVGHGDEIVVSEMEHHSNLVPWQLLAERNGAALRHVALTDDGHLDLDHLAALLGARTRVVALPHVSNALGTINPVREIAALVRDGSDAVLVLDGAQGRPTCRSMCSRWAVTSTPFPGTRCAARPGLVHSGDGGRSWRRCLRTREAAR